MKHYLTVNENQTIEGIQQKFNMEFPFLKMEFFMEKHQAGIGSERKKMYVDKTEKLFNIQATPKAGKVSIDADQSVQELEKEFEDKLGLFIQVFRKSGSVWLETSKTDNWTLAQQNETGRNLQEALKSEKENPEDHDIW